MIINAAQNLFPSSSGLAVLCSMIDEVRATRDEAVRRLLAKRRAENFPVAMRLLPRDVRADLIAVYECVRVIDDLGDEARGDRTRLLGEFAEAMAAIWDGDQPDDPVLRRLAPTVRARALPPEPFQQLVRANLLDQTVTRYPDYAALVDYSALSANPVGRLVLAVFGVDEPAACRLSDRVCTALQLVEHWQDVAEDRAAGRVYLPQADLAAFGVTEQDLDRSHAGPALRRLIGFETERAARLLDSGAALVRLLRGHASLAVAGYVAGGRAAVDSLRRSGGEVLAATPRPRKADVLRHAAVLLTGRTVMGGARMGGGAA